MKAKALQIKINAAHLVVFIDADGLIDAVYDDLDRDVWGLLYDLGMSDQVQEFIKQQTK